MRGLAEVRERSVSAAQLSNPSALSTDNGIFVGFSTDPRDRAIQEQQWQMALEHLNRSEVFRDLWSTLNNSTERITVRFVYNHGMSYNPDTKTINWDPTSGLIMENEKSIQSAALGLAHELAHVALHLEGHISYTYPTWGNIMLEEAELLQRFETPIARQVGEPIRTFYGEEIGVQRMNNPIHYQTTLTLPGRIVGVQHNHRTMLR
jgi:hypothetical protein